MGQMAFIHTLVIGSFFAVLTMMLVKAAPVDIVNHMPSIGSPALSARPEAAETDLDPSSQPTFDHLNTDFGKALMPCPEKPMDPLFGPGPVCEPQHGKTDGSKYSTPP